MADSGEPRRSPRKQKQKSLDSFFKPKAKKPKPAPEKPAADKGKEPPPPRPPPPPADEEDLEEISFDEDEKDEV